MKKTNKFLIIGTFIASVLTAGMVINNNINYNEIETGGNQLTSQEDNSSKSSRSFDSSNHGSVDFGTATPIIDLPDGDVEVVVNGFTDGLATGLSEYMALVIYPMTTIEGGKDEHLGNVKTTTTDLAGGATLTIEEDVMGTLVGGVEYRIYAARKKYNEE